MIEWMAWHDYGQRTDLEDVQEVGMLGVLEATQKIDITRVKSVDAYVAMVARSRMINYMQKMWNRDEILPDETIMLAMERALEENVELAMTMEDELGNLSPKERLVLKLRFWEDRELKDIAVILKCSTPNVWYIEKRALAKLAHAI